MCAGGRAYSNAHFGAGSGQIFLDDVQCTSSSNQLLECPSRPILSHNCLHSADAGVGCEGIDIYYYTRNTGNVERCGASLNEQCRVASFGWQGFTGALPDHHVQCIHACI